MDFEIIDLQGELEVINWTGELPKIDAAALAKGIDPAFIQAIRAQENGPTGKEFGVETEGVDTYEAQLEVTCNTIAHRLMSYTLNPLERDAFGRLRYTEKWIAYFANIWAPIGAPNDPNQINKNWYPNVVKLYAKFRGE